MNKIDSTDRVWDIIEKLGVCMLTTQFVGGLRARPLEARPDRNGGSIFFVTDIHSSKEDEIEPRQNVGLSSLIRVAKPACRSPTAPPSCAMLIRPRRCGENRRGLVARRPERSGRTPIARASHGGIVGRTSERCRYGFRVRQGDVDRGGTKRRRKPQGDGQDVSACRSRASEFGGSTVGHAAVNRPRRIWRNRACASRRSWQQRRQLCPEASRRRSWSQIGPVASMGRPESDLATK
jgi:hypothetical protein